MEYRLFCTYSKFDSFVKKKFTVQAVQALCIV